MRSVITIAAFALAASVIVPRYATQLHAGHAAPAPMTARQTPVQSASSNSRSVAISPGRNGHFEVEARVDGRRMDFMVDTGATMIALTARDAAMLGIHPAEHDYTGVVNTANGSVRVARVQLNRVEIDDLVVYNVAAMVMPEGALSNNLLGLTFLSRLRRFEYSDGKLVLEQ